MADFDIDPSKLLVKDDAYAARKRVPASKREPRYTRNKLPTAALALTSEEREEADKILDPARPGFVELIRGILR